jgi:uncharacterized SAM-binding protein YcdF (DUF218 family)
MADPAPAAEPVHKPRRIWLRVLLLAVLAIAGIVLFLLRWGGELLVSSDTLPAHVDAAVVLQGSMVGEIARVAGAVRLLQQGVPAQAVLSVPAHSYWGGSVPEEAHAYLERTYGPEIAGRFVFCETGPDVDSTRQEAEALLPCIRQHGWRTIVIVTSDYHSRRAGFLWRKIVHKSGLPVQMWIEGVPDPEYSARGWWRRRIWAKTWYDESSKVIWEEVFHLK